MASARNFGYPIRLAKNGQTTNGQLATSAPSHSKRLNDCFCRKLPFVATARNGT